MNDEQPRLTAHEIYEHVVQGGREELTRPVGQLAWSGVAGGLLMGLSGLGGALMRASLGDGEGAKLASFALYPAGFIAVILGRAQLFTENTLFPVVVVLREPARLARLFLQWAVVLACNLALENMIGAVAKRSSQTVEAVRAEAHAHLVPGVILQPSGVYAVLRAQEAGCVYLRSTNAA